MADGNLVAEFEGGGTVTQDGNLYIFTTQEPTREHISAWFETVSELLRSWEGDEILHMLFDATWGDTTPNYRQRLMELHAVARSLPIKTRSAILVNENQRSQLTTIAHLTGSGTDHRMVVFSDHDQALHWLEME